MHFDVQHGAAAPKIVGELQLHDAPAYKAHDPEDFRYNLKQTMWTGLNATRAVTLWGPASSASPNNGALPIVWVMGGALLAILWMIRERERRRALRAMAIRRGFSFLGRALPRSFTLRDTALDGATIWNIIDGDCRGIRVIAFDCRIGTGKGSWRRTAIAAQGPPDVFGAVKFNIDLTVDRSGDWSVLYQSRPSRSSLPGLMSISELEAHLDSIGR